MAPSIQSSIADLSLTAGATLTSLRSAVFGESSTPDHSFPLDPLTTLELQLAVSTIRAHASAAHPTATLWFKFCTLLEPRKAAFKSFLASHNAGEATASPPRLAQSLLAVKNVVDGKTEVTYYEYRVVLTSATEAEVLSNDKMPSIAHAALDMDEMLQGEQAVLKHPEVVKVIKSLNLPEGSEVVADPWCYGCDTMEQTPRFIKFLMYFRPGHSTDPNMNHYSFPLPFVPTLYTTDFSLCDIKWVPVYGGDSMKTLHDLPGGVGSFPWDKMQLNEYDHNLQVQAGGAIRGDLKPLEVVQKEGPSFTVKGWAVEWQKWQFRVGFNFREGLTIHDVRYDERDVFHRLSISDMCVPYGDPRPPLHRKMAFDLGDFGAGVCANQLDLGCDCLGHIHYFSAPIINALGETVEMKNVICMHEQDEGIGWKHTNFRTGVGSVVRNRVLVVQMIITVDNYEYVFAYKFDQAAGVHLETRATGILSTQTILPGERSPYGNVVAPGVLAANHQHIFSLRIDPAINGHNNSVVQEDSVPMDFDPENPPANNPYGVGYYVEKTLIEKSGFADAAPHKNRVFKIINPNKTNAVSGNNIAYKLVPAPSQMLLAHPKSIGAQRGEFGAHHIWVTKFADDELFSGGQYTQQSNGNAQGIKTWVARDDNVVNEDIVLWHSFGLTHNPRVEDYPVMPVEVHMISLKPADFFERSPAIDVPASTQKENKSVLFTSQQNAPGECCKV
ncbi:primary-amine oxidase, partial [Tremellales sp. Uapishka_1]